MVRRYDDPVDVRAVLDESGRLGDELDPLDDEVTPDAFLWRGRLYVVRTILARWHERRAWWRDPATSALLGLHADDLGLGGAGRGAGLDDADAHRTRTSLALAGECQVWRVEAAAGRSSPVGVYDLVHTRGPSDTWHLARVAD